MQVVSIISTKGGVGKTTTAANLGGFVADAGLRVLLLDLDVQPTLSSYYELEHRAPGGIYELLAFNERDLGQLVSRTIISGLDLVLSNDHRGELNTLLLHAPDGRLRLRHLLPVLAPLSDLVLPHRPAEPRAGTEAVRPCSTRRPPSHYTTHRNPPPPP